jgi:protein involved in polysaccharide export with SLBB domain
MSKKYLPLAALALAFCAQAGGEARAQRVGPVDDESPAASGASAARGDAKTDPPKADPSKVDPSKADPSKPVAAKADATKPDAAKGEPAAAKTSDTKAADKKAADGKSNDRANDKPAAKEDAKKGSADPRAEPGKTAAELSRSAAPAAGPLGERSTAPTPDGGAKSPPAATPAVAQPTFGALPSPPKYEPPAPVKVESSSSASAPAPAAPPPTAIYRVGIGDILDIRLVGGVAREMTLYTVLSNGTIDYPLAGEPLPAANLTPEEIGARLSAALKRRGIFDRAQFQITVRDYVSHTVLVSGLVDQPGQKVLRREAVPLYVVLAEAFPRAEAGRVVLISRATGQTRTLDLSDSNALNELVAAGDIVNVQPRPREFFYIGGQINSAGQKDFNPGMTLTQAILASGGLAREAGAKVRVAVARQGADGRLVTSEYLLQEIESGKIPDPRIQPGDRIEVGRRR